MPRLLFLFLDGVGLGVEDPARNPFAAAEMPALHALLEGRRLVLPAAPEFFPAVRSLLGEIARVAARTVTAAIRATTPCARSPSRFPPPTAF